MDPVTLGMANANARKTYAPRRHSTMVAIGDSITAPGGTGNGEWPSFVEHLTILSNQAVKLIYNAGVPSQTAAQIAARFQSDVIAKKPRWVSILAGTNDVPVPTPLATYQANIKSMVESAINAGIGVFLCLMPPRSDSATTALRCAAWNDWLRAYAVTKPEVILIDLHTSLADSAGMWKTEYLKDGIHPNAAGALQMATVFRDTIAPHFIAPPLLPTLGVDYAFGEAVNLLRNPLCKDPEVDGTINGYSWFQTTLQAGTTRSIVTNDSRFAGSSVKFTFNSPPIADGFQQSISNTKWSPGETLRLVGKIAVDSAASIPATQKGISVKLVCTGAATPDQYAVRFMPNVLTGVYQKDIVIPAGTTAINWQTLADYSTTGVGSVSFGQVSVQNLTRDGIA
jgi:lysophospholipase L1-like esterase